jgi:hypothetical protein
MEPLLNGKAQYDAPPWLTTFWHQLLFILKILFTFVTKQGTLMRRPAVLSLVFNYCSLTKASIIQLSNAPSTVVISNALGKTFLGKKHTLILSQYWKQGYRDNILIKILSFPASVAGYEPVILSWCVECSTTVLPDYSQWVDIL